MTEVTEIDRYAQAATLVVTNKRASISWLQRQMSIGYNSAKALIDRMEDEGIVSAAGAMGARTILKDEVQLGQMFARKDFEAITRATIEFTDGDEQLQIPVELPRANRAADERLQLLIERVEHLQEEAKGIADDIKDVFGEVKATGYDVKIVRQIIKLRRMKPDARREQEQLLETYKCALGMD